MLRRKLITGFLVVALSIGTYCPAFAMPSDLKSEVPNPYVQQENSAKISKDKAKEIANKKIKDTFNIDINNRDLDYYIDFGPNGYNDGYSWYISYSNYDEKQSRSYSVVIDANSGKVIGFNKSEYVYSENQPEKPIISKAKAKEIAENYVQKLNQTEYTKFKFIEETNSEENQPINYYFRYARVVNGVEFDRDSIYIEIDGIKGNVLSYGYNYMEDINFPTVDNIISKEKAMNILKTSVGMKLSYMNIYDKNDYDKINDIKVVYNPEYKDGTMVDAKDGKIVSWGVVEEYNNQDKIKNITDSKKEEIFKSAKPVAKLEKDLNKEEANKIIRSKVKEFFNRDVNITIEGDAPVNSFGKKVWLGTYGTKNSDGGIQDGGEVSLDASTGEITYIYAYDENESIDGVFTPKLTWEQGYDKAIEVIAKYFPDKIKEIKTDIQQMQMTYKVDDKDINVRYGSFYFPRIANGLEYNTNGINVNFDMKTGELKGLGCTWNDNVKIPNINNIISKEEANNAFFNNQDTKLIYTIIDTSKDPKNPKYEVKLTYILNQKNSLKPVYNIDATNGKAIDYDGNK